MKLKQKNVTLAVLDLVFEACVISLGELNISVNLKSGRLKANFYPLISQASSNQSPQKRKGIVNKILA